MRRAVPDDLREGLKAAVRRAVIQLGGLKVAAHALGVSPSQTQRLGAADQPDMPSAAHLAALALAGSSAPAEFLAELAGGRFVPGADDGGVPSALAAAGGAINEASEVISQLSQAMADGRVDEAEARRIERALADFEEVAAALKGVLRRPRRRR